MSGHPTLTVAILTFNSGATIGACLDSLVAQEHQDFEVLVVDDDSMDDTLAIVSGYSGKLRIRTCRNGSHLIPRGRNIGLESSQSDVVAFIDSDDRAAPSWTHVITEAFRAHPAAVLIAGALLPAYRSLQAGAISANDHAIRRLFGSGVIQFCAGNCAVNRALAPGLRFNEEFRFAEDLELAARISDSEQRLYIPHMQIHHYSRERFWPYAKQMFRYAYMKQQFSYRAGDFRLIDFVPLTILAGSLLASLITTSWWFLLILPAFSVAEAAFTASYERCTLPVALLTPAAWLVKNFAWSGGMACGWVALAVNGQRRRVLRAKHVSAAPRMRAGRANGAAGRP
jgi:cellulose synthase/poly-beta-1,6-N-acetylglucosamine synthase-like glycosyltransferase